MRKLRGFLLIEVSIALCALGILTAMVVPLVQSMALGSRRIQTQKACKTALRVLALYVETRGWLPFAANSDGQAVPGLFVGHLPYRTLCLDRKDALDGRGKLLTYIVCPSLTQTSPRNPLRKKQNTSSSFLTVVRDRTLNVFYSDGTPVLPPEEEKDFCAIVVMGQQGHSNAGYVHEAQGAIDVILPKGSPSSFQWVSRNNLISLFGS